MTNGSRLRAADLRTRAVSVRARVLGGLVIMSVLAMTVAGFTAFFFERQRLDQAIDADLNRNISEFAALAEQGLDPSTGAPFESVGMLLRTGLQRIAMSPNEGMLAFVDGEVSNTAPTTVPLRLEEDPELMAELSGLLAEQVEATADGLSQGILTQIETAQTAYRVAVVPVALPDDDAVGTLVLAFDRTAEHAEMANTYQLYAVVAGALVIVISIVGWVSVGRILQPIRALREAADSITSSEDLSRRIPVTGDDELAALTDTVNQMLDRLEQAFASQRQLLDDAGHELRTPLTIVRGHVELLDPDDPADVSATKDLVADELDRMSVLVEDLMTLARARRPDFVNPRPTDNAMLTAEVLSKARLLGERRWILEELAEVTSTVDPQRITQALLQLCANAVRFSEPDSQVAIGSRVEQQSLYLWVRDEGTGIAAEDIGRIFGRFERLNPDIEGSGLGLPIVGSIAVAHGGDVSVSSTPGRGTTVTLRLPLEASISQTPATQEIP